MNGSMRCSYFCFPFTSITAKNSSGKRRERGAEDQDQGSTPASTFESSSSANPTDIPTVEDDDSFSWDDEDDEEFEDPSKKEPSFLKSEQMAVLMAREDDESLRLIGHSFDDMVLSSTYRGVSCR